MVITNDTIYPDSMSRMVASDTITENARLLDERLLNGQKTMGSIPTNTDELKYVRDLLVYFSMFHTIRACIQGILQCFQTFSDSNIQREHRLVHSIRTKRQFGNIRLLEKTEWEVVFH